MDDKTIARTRPCANCGAPMDIDSPRIYYCSRACRRGGVGKRSSKAVERGLLALYDKARCSVCKRAKPKSAFGRRRRGGVIRLRGECKACVAEAMAKYLNTPHGREMQAKYIASPQGVAVRRAAKQRHQKSESYKASIAKYRRESRDKLRARNAVQAALRAGRITRAPCEVCGRKAEAHHWKGYDEEHWLTIKWLCPKHHALEHRLQELPRCDSR